jgi:hypothetical protein
MPQKKEIIYPFFLECYQFCEDTFWETIFEDLTYGKAPYGTYISKGFLCCSYKNKEFSYKIERKDPKILFTDIYTLLTDKVGIVSQKEKIRKKIVFNELEKNLKQSKDDWASIRRKNIKDVMYEKYVIDMKNKHNLSVQQCKYLLALLTVAIMFKSITTKDIDYQDEKIISINGINFSEGKITLSKPLCSGSEVILDTPMIDNNVKIMAENWPKYLKTL